MGYVTVKATKMLAKRLQRIIEEDLGLECRLGWCQSAIAEAFDFDSSSEMFSRLPLTREFNREWCINHLTDEGRVSDEAAARSAIAILEERFGGLISGLPEHAENPD